MRVIDAHRRHVAVRRRSVTLEHRDPDLPDASADELARSLSADDTSPSRHLMRQERHERLKTALASLSRRNREVLAMRQFEQLGTAEIAAMLSIGEAAVKSRLLRALMRMRDLMGGPE